MPTPEEWVESTFSVPMILVHGVTGVDDGFIVLEDCDGLVSVAETILEKLHGL